ncbi:IniB N-terminal domain-containing protein [Amycolatopsis acidiphila]|uniref:Uncharacterized protein n=1 Tax=Amycolatopsis acidiphila TaxID=715473 RepID=A0A557ZZ59_9PSEU|nr:IniB N-terminal domain-containing protein [Amycolatopsis acidiphila]TVT17299.1 hypothetical protein FNH06_31975 [Amycolatopsis acidiphila]UIJ61459.1 IniB N-terminal domain-containing protein [Amycolatopsis acidiphila]GHG59801.1 hypothetical protein GCM10017788_13540 [Amycolatopsis acidiphila]
MSQPIQTLHDFVLNLITDDSFGTSFLSDPAGVLSGAGLGDVTGLDVQEVTSLVADHLPAPVADAVESGFAALPADVTGVNDLHCALAHLETVAAVAQDLPVSVAGLSPSTTFAGDAGGFTGAAALTGDLVQTSGSLAGSTGGLAGGALADTPAGAVTGAVAAATDSVAAGVQSPLGTYGVATDSLPLSVPSFGSVSDLGGTLDSDALTHGTSATAVAGGYVASGGEFAAAGIADNSATLAGHLSSVGDVAAQPVAAGGDELATHVASGADTLGDVVSHVPSVAAPAQLPADLPVHAVADLPQSLPTPDSVLPQVTHTVESTVSHAPLTDSVSHSSLIDSVHSALPDVGDLHTDLFHGDLPLGH